MSARVRFLATSLALLATGTAAVWWQAPAARPAAGVARPPGPDRLARPPAPVSARGVLERRDELGLSAAQVVRLEELDRRWTEETEALRASVEATQRELAAFMSAQAGQRAPLAEIERRSADYRAASADLREQRRRHAQATLEVLSETQRRAVGPATPESNGERR